FAILLWEISSHKIPFDDIKNDMQVSEKIKENKRPSPFAEDTPEKYIKIIEQAWDHDFNDRPTIQGIRKQLGNLRNKENKLKPLKRNDSETSLSSISSIASIEVSVVPKKNSLGDEPLSNLLDIEEAISLHNKERYKEAFPHLQQLAQNGNPKAAYYAGLYLYKGYGVDKDEIKALQLLEKSAV
ncbi:4824_t:CDS:1, partial [Acaulospora colombiana]